MLFAERMAALTPHNEESLSVLYPRELRVRVSEAMYARIIQQASMRELSLSAVIRQAFSSWLKAAEK